MNILGKLLGKLGAANQDCINISATLGHDEVLMAGDVRVEPLFHLRRSLRSVGTSVMVGVGSGLAIFIDLDDNNHVNVQCFSDGKRLPRIKKVTEGSKQIIVGNKAKSEKLRPTLYAPRPTAVTPLCKFGPGGDYVCEYTPGADDANKSPIENRKSEIAKGAQPA